jgi:glycosyltransferase involved in cell wall biosynthesis
MGSVSAIRPIPTGRLTPATEALDAPASTLLRILMVSARYLPFMGGIETHIHEVGSRLVAQGHTVVVLTTDPTWNLPPTETISGMSVIRVRAWPKGADYCFAPRVHTELMRGAWDVVHIQGYHTFAAPLGMIAAIKRRVPFVVTFHSGGHSSRLRNSLRAAQHAVLRPLISRADQLIGVSEFEVDFFSSRMGIRRDRFVVIPNGACLAAAPRRPALDRDRPLIVSIGRVERYKGHHRAIEAFSRLLARLPGARLRVLGQGPYEPQLRRLVRRLGLDERVEIGGIPPRDRGVIADLLGHAALVVLLSEYEAHPVAVMEALSLGRPVLTSDTSGFKELARKGLVRAVPINDSSPEDIAQAMREHLSSDPPTASVALPDWNDCADRLLAVYQTAALRTDAAARPSGSVTRTGGGTHPTAPGRPVSAPTGNRELR